MHRVFWGILVSISVQFHVWDCVSRGLATRVQATVPGRKRPCFFPWYILRSIFNVSSRLQIYFVTVLQLRDVMFSVGWILESKSLSLASAIPETWGLSLESADGKRITDKQKLLGSNLPCLIDDVREPSWISRGTAGRPT